MKTATKTKTTSETIDAQPTLAEVIAVTVKYKLRIRITNLVFSGPYYSTKKEQESCELGARPRPIISYEQFFKILLVA